MFAGLILTVGVLLAFSIFGLFANVSPPCAPCGTPPPPGANPGTCVCGTPVPSGGLSNGGIVLVATGVLLICGGAAARVAIELRHG
jgi:hypothetical protein